MDLLTGETKCLKNKEMREGGWYVDGFDDWRD